MTEIRDIGEGDHDSWRRLFTEYGVFYKTDFSDSVLDGVWAWLMDAEADVCAVVAVDDGRAFASRTTAGCRTPSPPAPPGT